MLSILHRHLSGGSPRAFRAWPPPCGIELEPERPPEADTWTPAQARQFIRTAEGDPLALAFRVALLTGIAARSRQSGRFELLCSSGYVGRVGIEPTTDGL